MAGKPKYFITTAIVYTSGKPHIGNNYEIILSDAVARFRRREGYDVLFLTGTDEHGEKIERKAEAAGVPPQEFVDGICAGIKDLYEKLDISYDRFIRTTDEAHVRSVARIFERMRENGDIYKGTYKGWYCTPCESFWTESQLVDGKCPDCGREVETAEEEAYFFRMSKYADRLLKYYEENPGFIVPVQRKAEMVNNFLKPGLQDLCVSRSTFSWGVPVSSDREHVVYVWLDALSNYITALGYDGDGGPEEFSKYWPADVHVIGKDIMRFHSVYWPIFLMSLGLPLPKKIFGHPWLMQDGGKMSKSKGNVMYADDLVSVFGTDAVRYYVLSEMQPEDDGVIGWERLTEKTNSDLANVFGNLVSRTAAMINKYCGGVLENAGETGPEDEGLISASVSAYDRMRTLLDDFEISNAISEVFNIFRHANKYIDDTQPWVLARDPGSAPRLKTVLYNLAESIVTGASLLEPFMPGTGKRVTEIFGQGLRDFRDTGKFGLIPDGTRVSGTPGILFRRREVSEVLEAAAALAEKKGSEA